MKTSFAALLFLVTASLNSQVALAQNQLVVSTNGSCLNARDKIKRGRKTQLVKSGNCISKGVKVTDLNVSYRGYRHVQLSNGNKVWLFDKYVSRVKSNTVRTNPATSTTQGSEIKLKGNYIIRSRAQKSSRQAGLIPKNQTATLIGCGYQNNRCLVEYNGVRGYIPQNSYTEITATAPKSNETPQVASPTAATQTASPENTNGEEIKLKGNYIIRSKPSKNSARAGLIPKDQTATLIGCEHQNNRCLVEYKGIRGYIPQNSYTKTEQVPAHDTTVNQTPRSTASLTQDVPSAEDQYARPTLSGNTSATDTPMTATTDVPSSADQYARPTISGNVSAKTSPVATVDSTNQTTEPATTTEPVQTTPVNPNLKYGKRFVKDTYIIRAEASQSSAKLDTIPAGQELEVLGCGYPEDRCLVKYQGTKGYIPKAAIRNEKRSATTTYIIRQSDSKDSPNIGSIPGGAEAEVISCGHSENRCLIKYNGVSGYVPEKGLVTSIKFQILPVCECTGWRCRHSSKYGMRRHPILRTTRLHSGDDIAAPTGTPVVAVGAGRVIKAGRNGGYGKQIKIRHSNGLETAYSHLHRIQRGIRVGVEVKAGEKIGTIGSTGLSTGPHLHFEIKKDGKFVNPSNWIPTITSDSVKRSCPVPGAGSGSTGGSVQ